MVEWGRGEMEQSPTRAEASPTRAGVVSVWLGRREGGEGGEERGKKM